MHGHWKRERFARGPHREGWGAHGGPGGWGRRLGGGRRMLEQGALRLIVLALLGEQPRHGYDLIKEIERRAGGGYAPSPGVIYPLLTMLEEMGLAEMRESEGAKKLYALTAEGEAELAANKGEADALLSRIAAAGERHMGGRAPQILRAIENLKVALRLRAERGPLTQEQIDAVAAAIDTAAQTIERT